MGKPCCVTLAAVTGIVLIAAAVSAAVVGILYFTKTETPEGWEMAANFKSGEDAAEPVYKMRSKRSDITAGVYRRKSSETAVHVCLPVEADGLDGLPNQMAHALEYFILKGRSKTYPYYNSLVDLAPLYLAYDVRAKTTTDGDQCFSYRGIVAKDALRMLEAVLDHLFWPDLNDKDFLTLIHHVNREGEDDGEMYTEIKGMEGYDIPSRYVKRELFNPGKEGSGQLGVYPFAALENIRNGSLDVYKLGDYHKKYYRPGRVSVFVFGDVRPKQVAEALKPVEDELLEKHQPMVKDPLPPRPSNRQSPPIKTNMDLVEEYPELRSVVSVAWMLNFSLAEDAVKYKRSRLLFSYLFKDQSPKKDEPLTTFRKEMNDRDLRDASLQSAHLDGSQPALVLKVTLPANSDRSASSVTLRAVQDTLDRVDRDGLNMTLLMEIVESQKKASKYRSKLNVLAERFVQDMLYSDSSDDLSSFLLDDWDKEVLKTSEFGREDWFKLFKEVFMAPRLQTKLFSNPVLAKSNERADQTRMNSRRRNLGSKEIDRQAHEAESAAENQEDSKPSDLFYDDFAYASPADFAYPRLRTYNNTPAGRGGLSDLPSDFKLGKIPYRFYASDAAAGDLVQATIVFDLRNLSDQEWQYVHVIDKMSLVAQKVRKKSSVHVGHIDHWYKVEPFDRMAFGFSMRLGVANYTEAVSACKEEIFNSVPDIETLRRVLKDTEIRGGLNELDPYNDALVNRLNYKDDYPGQRASFLKIQQFSEEAARRLDRSPAGVLVELKDALKKALRAENAFVHLKADIGKLVISQGEMASKVWEDFFGNESSKAEADNNKKDLEFVSDSRFLDTNKRNKYAVAVADEADYDGCLMEPSVPLMMETKTDPQYADLTVALKYVEEEMKKRVFDTRDCVYKPVFKVEPMAMPETIAQGQVARSSLRKGLTTYQMKGCKEPGTALDALFDVAAELTQTRGEKNWDRGDFERAKYGSILDALRRIGGGGDSAVFLLEEGVDPLFDHRLAKDLAAVTMDSAADAARAHLSAFGRPGAMTVAATCGTSRLGGALRRSLERTEAVGGGNVVLIEDMERSSIFNY